ncbi:DUF84 family protein, partial [Bacillus sp. SS-TM]
MKVVVGSKNKTKVGAVEKVWKDAEITSLSVPSGVSAQPSSSARFALLIAPCIVSSS